MKIALEKIFHCPGTAVLIAGLIFSTAALGQNPPPPGQGMPPPPPGGMHPPPPDGQHRPPPPPRPFPEPGIQEPAKTIDIVPVAAPVQETTPALVSTDTIDTAPPEIAEENTAENLAQNSVEQSEAPVPEVVVVHTPPETITETKVVVVQEPAAGWPWILLAACIILFLGWWYSSRRTASLENQTELLARKQRQLQSAHKHLKQHSEQLRELSIHDPLTGTLNRQAFAHDFRKSLDHLAKFSRPMNLIVFDLDHFKSINDKQGHLAGDNALKLVVGIVRQHLVSEDLFSRFGGDEFVIACADQPIQATFALAEKIRLNVEQQANTEQPALSGLSLSMGISQASPELGYDADSLFERADKALYAAKNRGRNQVIICDDSLPDLPDIESTRRHI